MFKQMLKDLLLSYGPSGREDARRCPALSAMPLPMPTPSGVTRSAT